MDRRRREMGPALVVRAAAEARDYKRAEPCGRIGERGPGKEGARAPYACRATNADAPFMARPHRIAARAGNRRQIRRRSVARGLRTDGGRVAEKAAIRRALGADVAGPGAL